MQILLLDYCLFMCAFETSCVCVCMRNCCRSQPDLVWTRIKWEWKEPLNKHDTRWSSLATLEDGLFKGLYAKSWTQFSTVLPADQNNPPPKNKSHWRNWMFLGWKHVFPPPVLSISSRFCQLSSLWPCRTTRPTAGSCLLADIEQSEVIMTEHLLGGVTL